MIDLPQLRPLAHGGKAYWDEFKAIYAEIKGDLERDARALMVNGKLTVGDLCTLALKHRLNCKATADMLEELRILPCGAYDRIKERGFKPMAMLREVWAEMQGDANV